MATTKRKSTTKAAAPASSASKSPFKTKRSTAPTKPADNIISPPPAVAEAVDAFRAAQDQAKYYEGEMAIHKNAILDFASERFAERLFAGDSSGFKVQGIETMAMFVVQDASAGLSEEDVEDFAQRWGRKAADELISRDFASIRFNDAVLEAHYDTVVKALQTIPAEILDHLFKPMAMKASSGAAEAARRHTKNPEELREMLRHLKLRHYVR